ncbi:hypothetical protein AAF712_002934 [Marasmius tenuissimus]|uniref:DUF6535 domain-containing protein n=1 Tax=Marasmius tenuissimus TaxID=585030 RepID=A0ABR3A7T6_9AGAR
MGPEEVSRPNKNDSKAKKNELPPSHEKPTMEKSWEVVTKEVTAHDEALFAGWKDDIDTLLVFAGLFSAVVTAFTVESYRWLEEDPADTTVTLLRQIAHQITQNGTSVTLKEFEVSPSALQINTLWFLSLIIALVDALFGLLCKQWLREHRRPTHTRTPEEALALRWLRHESLEQWQVLTILASLPILLELALFLFLAGLLELLRVRHPIPFAIASAIVASAVLLYLGTTIIPSVDVIRQAFQVSPDLRRMHTDHVSYSPVRFIAALPPMEHMCPYKSPQAWVVLQGFKSISRLPGFIRTLYYLHGAKFIPSHWSNHGRGSKWAFNEIMSSLSDWDSVDLEILRRVKIDGSLPQLYDLYALRWLVAGLRDNPIMVPHLLKILEPMDPHVVMAGVLDQWFFLPEREWTSQDVRDAIRLPGHLEARSRLADYRKYFMATQRKTPLFNQLLHCTHLLIKAAELDKEDVEKLPELLRDLWDRSIQGEFQGIGFPVPLRLLDNPAVGELGPGLLGLFNKIADSRTTKEHYWVTLAHDLARHIISSSPDYALKDDATLDTSSKLVESKSGVELLRRMHNVLVEENSFEDAARKDVRYWVEAMEIVRRVHGLPEGHFKAIPGFFPLPLSKLEKALNSLSPGDPDSDLAYWLSFKKNWRNANFFEKEDLVRILSNCVNNYPQSNPQSLAPPSNRSIDCPLLTLPTGLKLLAFVNNELAADKTTHDWMEERDLGLAWDKVRRRVAQPRGRLPRSFRPIRHNDRYHDPEQYRYPANRELDNISDFSIATSVTEIVVSDDDSISSGRSGASLSSHETVPSVYLGRERASQASIRSAMTGNSIPEAPALSDARGEEDAYPVELPRIVISGPGSGGLGANDNV